jgi:hypothetical protein
MRNQHEDTLKLDLISKEQSEHFFTLLEQTLSGKKQSLMRAVHGEEELQSLIGTEAILNVIQLIIGINIQFCKCSLLFLWNKRLMSHSFCE